MRNTSEIEWELAISEQFSFMYNKLSMDDVKKLQEAFLGMYKSFEAKCNSLNLTAYMVAGTLIGSLRHKGYIPWDDDIDLVMFRDDFERLKSEFDQDDEFELVDPTARDASIHKVLKIKSKNLTYFDVLGEGFSKRNHLYLDLLPIDFVPENRVIRQLKGTIFKALSLSYASARCYNRYSPHLSYLSKGSLELSKNILVRKIIGFPTILLKPYRVFRIMESILRSEKRTSKVTIAHGVKGYMGEIVDFDVFFPSKSYIFEDSYFQGPNKAETYLTNRYGDFMIIPDKKEQFERHIRLKDNWKELVELK